MADIATKEINGFYAKYAAKEGITLAEAKRRISTADIAEYAKKAEKYVPAKDLSDKANEEMRLYNAMMSINRLEMLKSSIGLGMVDGFDELEQTMREHLTDAAEEEFVRQAGILGGTVRNPREAASTIVNSSFHNATFSQRIWMHQDMLRSELDKVLQEGLIKGESSLKLARHIQKVFGASQKDAERLMRTEMSRVYTEAQKESYDAAGYEDYTYIALGDACEICSPLDGKHFKVKQMRVGENAPPMHPNCRCSTAPWIDRSVNGQELEENRFSFENQNGIIIKEIESEADLGKALKETLGGVRHQTRQFERELTRIAGEDEKKLLQESYNRTTIVKSDSKKSYYDGKVHLSKNAGPDTIAHELFHEIDEYYGMIQNGLLKTSVFEDYFEITKQASARGKTVQQHLAELYPEAFDSIEMGQEKLKKKYRGISDILHGCSNGTIDLGYGHRTPGYWQAPNALQEEAFAQHGRMAFQKDKDVLKMYRNLFPKTEKEIVIALKGIV